MGFVVFLMGCSRQEYCTWSPWPPPKDLPDPGIESASYVSCISGRFYTTSATWQALYMSYLCLTKLIKLQVSEPNEASEDWEVLNISSTFKFHKRHLYNLDLSIRFENLLRCSLSYTWLEPSSTPWELGTSREKFAFLFPLLISCVFWIFCKWPWDKKKICIEET